MTLDEAIKHCEEVADTPCFTDEEARCYSEHRQLTEWLKELKIARECIERIRIAIRIASIYPELRGDVFEDEVIEAMKKYLYYVEKEWES